MVSFVESSADTRRTLLYNEEKLAEGKALFLGAFNYWQEDAELRFDDKLRRLQNLTVLNERVHKHTIHFSLNFHPHAHIVTVKVRPDGSGIENDKRSPHYMARVCAEIERRHHLTPALAAVVERQPINTRQPIISRLEYGKSPTKTGIAGVLEYVLDEFAYTSIEELNAVLSRSNVRADRGSEQGLMCRLSMP